MVTAVIFLVKYGGENCNPWGEHLNLQASATALSVLNQGLLQGRELQPHTHILCGTALLRLTSSLWLDLIFLMVSGEKESHQCTCIL